MMQKSFYNRITAWVAILATVLVMLFSEIYIDEHISHECTGEECPVCMVLHLCSSFLKTIGTAVVAAFSIVIFISALLKTVLLDRTDRDSRSLVSLKVRLDN